ncbi:hypothetical protein D3C86_1368770 [compost metagenome]
MQGKLDVRLNDRILDLKFGHFFLCGCHVSQINRAITGVLFLLPHIEWVPKANIGAVVPRLGTG